MKFVNPLPFVADMKRAKDFYSKVLELKIVQDCGNFVQFDNGFALHEGSSLFRTIFGRDVETVHSYGCGNLVLYFEVDDIDATYCRIGDQLDLIHGVRRQDWGQRVFRFYDPDGHIVEIGEPQNTASSVAMDEAT